MSDAILNALEDTMDEIMFTWSKHKITAIEP